jgi:hypothetical protein
MSTMEQPAMLHAPLLLHDPSQLRSRTILTMRQGSICMMILTMSMLRWLYMRYVHKTTSGTKGGVTIATPHPIKSLTGNGIDHSQRTIVHNFDQDESDHGSLSPLQRMTLSPRKRQLLNRRFMIEQEHERRRQAFSRSSSYQLDQLESSKQVTTDNNSKALIDRLLIPNSPPSPLFRCEGTVSHSSNSDVIQQLRQRKSPLVPMTKPKVSLHS